MSVCALKRSLCSAAPGVIYEWVSSRASVESHMTPLFVNALKIRLMAHSHFCIGDQLTHDWVGYDSLLLLSEMNLLSVCWIQGADVLIWPSGRVIDVGRPIYIPHVDCMLNKPVWGASLLCRRDKDSLPGAQPECLNLDALLTPWRKISSNQFQNITSLICKSENNQPYVWATFKCFWSDPDPLKNV